MKTIIIPVDFSPAALNALTYGVNLAADLQAKIFLLFVQEIPISYQSGDIVMPVIDLNELENVAKQRLEETKGNILRVTGKKQEIESVVKIGFFEEELKEFCNEHQPLGVIMSTKNTDALDRILLGSSANRVIKELTYPVVIVPQGAVYKGIKKISFACDYKNVNETIAAEQLKKWINAFDGAEFNVIHVDDKNKKADMEKPDEAVKLFDLLKDLKPKFHFIQDEDVETGIKTFAETNNIDLQVVVYKHYGFFESLFRKSQATEIVLHSHIPVLSLPELHHS